MKGLENANVTGQTVLLRLELNTPIVDGQVSDDSRLRSHLPTINYLLNRQARVVLVGHLGRPKGKKGSEFSLKPVYERLASLLKKPIKFTPHVIGEEVTQHAQALEAGEILGLENLRFEPGEEINSRTFARSLAKLADVYVNDAFASSHNKHASMDAVTEFLPSYAGLLMEKEYLVLTNLMRHPSLPFVAIIGGAKVKEKLPVLKHLSARTERILVGGAVANTFLQASGVNVRDSLVETSLLTEAADILKRAKGKIILPVDFIWDEGVISDIGPKTAEQYEKILATAKTIFWAGSLGIAERPAFAHGSTQIAHFLSSSKATTIVGGGDTAAIVHSLRLENRLTFVSTGGSATLKLLSGEPLHAIEILN